MHVHTCELEDIAAGKAKTRVFADVSTTRDWAANKDTKRHQRKECIVTYNTRQTLRNATRSQRGFARVGKCAWMCVHVNAFVQMRACLRAGASGFLCARYKCFLCPACVFTRVKDICACVGAGFRVCTCAPACARVCGRGIACAHVSACERMNMLLCAVVCPS